MGAFVCMCQCVIYSLVNYSCVSTKPWAEHKNVSISLLMKQKLLALNYCNLFINVICLAQYQWPYTFSEGVCVCMCVFGKWVIIVILFSQLWGRERNGGYVGSF